MAKFQTKPLDQLSPAYRKRIERGLAAGLSRSQARGHTGKTELPAQIQKLSYNELRKRPDYWLVSGIKKIGNKVGTNSKEYKQAVVEYKKLLKHTEKKHTSPGTIEKQEAIKHERETARQIRKLIKDNTESGEDLDFVIDFGDSA